MTDDPPSTHRTSSGRSRRRLLAALAGGGALAASSALAGCLDAGSGTATTSAGGTTSDDADADTAGETDGGRGTGDGTAPGTTSDLDLSEANVVGVETDAGDDGTRFSVTLYHDDDGEDGYANWWAVETLDGEELGRRELAHAHGTREFTRSETISLPDGVSCVVVRGHDQTHEYGGRAALVATASGETRFADQGSEPTSFAVGDCPDDGS